jgi:drug/metabolite transporter (DMT)-like permease
MKEETSPHTFPPGLIGLLAGLTLGWGLNWPMMKLVVSEMQPMHYRSFCLTGGAIGLLAITRLKGLTVRVPQGQWGRLVAVALFNITIWNVLSIYGVRLMASGRAAILGYTMPAWSVLLSIWLLREPFTKRRATGVTLGLMGMGLLLGSEIQAVGRSPLGALLMIGAAVCWAFAIVIMKRWPVGLPTTAYVGWQMLIGVVPILVVALTWEGGSFNPFALSRGPMLGVFYSLMIGYIFCYSAWTKIVVIVPAGVSSLAVMMTPVVGVFSGVLVLGEKPSWQDFAALVAVMTSLATVMLPPRKTKSSLSSA